MYFIMTYLAEKFDATKVKNFEDLTSKSDIIFLSYIDQHFNPIIQVKQKKRIWDLWYHFSDSKFNKIFHKESDFKKFSVINPELKQNIIQLNKKFG